jgi:hypothetical protein
VGKQTALALHTVVMSGLESNYPNAGEPKMLQMIMAVALFFATPTPTPTATW